MNTTLHTYEPLCKDPLGSFELQRIFEHQKQMRLELRKEIENRDMEIFSLTERICPRCSMSMYSHGRTNPSTYLATCGEVTVNLRRLRCTNCRHILVPGASLLPDNSVSAVLAERLCDLASKMSYSKAANSLYIQHGIIMSTTNLWTCVQKEAMKIDDIVKEEATKLFRTGEIPNCVDLHGKLPLIIGIDGGMVSKWQKKGSFEVKCATIATHSSAGPGNKRHLNSRVGYAANCSVEEFRKRVSLLSLKAGYNTASMRIFVSDGAHWIGKMISDYFPDAIHVLDMYHLKNKIRMLFGLKASGNSLSICERALAACDEYDPASIYRVISSWLCDDIDKLSRQAELLLYIKNNSSAIRNHKLVSIHGSGWIEKGVDLMISRRLKNRGMAWTLPGSSHMIPFSVLQYNNQWNDYWFNRKGLSSSQFSNLN